MATIRDVAKLAGVSVTTAHRGITGKNELGAATRERVLAAARELTSAPKLKRARILAVSRWLAHRSYHPLINRCQ